MTTVGTVKTSPWIAPRRRAEALREQHRFAGEVLGLYLALLEVWEDTWAAADADLGAESSYAEIAAWSAERVLPRVVVATAQAGPQPLVEQLLEMNTGDVVAAEQLLTAWLAGEGLDPVERYLARATLRAPLEAVGAAEAKSSGVTLPGVRHCPNCGGLPQLSFRDDTGNELAKAARQLQCVRCRHSWSFSSTACASCGESRGGRLTYHSERAPGSGLVRSKPGETTFPHLRVEACGSCSHYLIDVDLGLDPRAVPEVDELAAIPLDLYAADQGLRKIAPNMMGF